MSDPYDASLPCILLVEDDCVDAEAVGRAFRRYGIRNPLHRACDGVEGFEALRGSASQPPIARPCLIIVDLMMPRMNGLEFLAGLRADPGLAGLPAIVCTTSDDQRDRDAAMRHEPLAFVIKSELDAHLPVFARVISAASPAA